MPWQEVRKGPCKGGSGLQASLTAMQNSMAQLAASIQNTYTPQGKGGSPQGKGAGKGGATSDPSQRGLRALRRRFNAQAVQLSIGQHAVHADPAVGNWPRGLPHRNHHHRPRDRCPAARRTIVLLCGIIWLVLRQCCQRVLRPGRWKGKGQGPHDPKGREPGPHPGNSPRVRPSQRGIPEPAGPATQRSQRSASTRSQARFGNCQTTESGSQGPEVQGSPEAGRRGLAFCPRRKSGIRLRVGKPHGQQQPPPHHRRNTPRRNPA